MEEGRRLALQRHMLLMIAAQQTRAAGADGNAARQRRRGGFAIVRRLGESEKIIGGEVESATRRERAQPVLRGKAREVRRIDVEDAAPALICGHETLSERRPPMRRSGGYIAGRRRDGKKGRRARFSSPRGLKFHAANAI